MLEPAGDAPADRKSEWFAPKFGPEKFRSAVGLLFLPYTGMVLSFAVIGSMIAREIYWDRLLAVVVIYFLGLGIAAHALDAIGARGAKPWGNVFSRKQLWFIAGVALAGAYALAVYYMVRFVPFLWIIAVAEKSEERRLRLHPPLS